MRIRRNKRTQQWSRGESGFTILQTAIAVAIMGVICGFAVMSLTSAKASLRLQNSVRQLSSYLEKARIDAIRRHGTSSVVFTDTGTYVVSMDFAGSGTVSTRTIPFEQGVAIISTPLPAVNFNWRGRTSACTLTFAVQNSGGEQSWVDVSDAGDVTVNSNVDVMPSASYATVSGTSDVESTAVVTGSGVHNNTVDCSGSGGGTAGPPISGSGIGCTDTANPSSIAIRKNGGSSATVTVTATNTGTVSVQAPINIRVTPATQTVTGGSSVSFGLSSLNNTRGTFAVNFNSPCTTLTVLLTVTN
ncbi:MAG TPA: GspH/FimT family pseudopilin [Pyrinomonadaceae bacterium]|nr:GspH/FimT family pseudopilin [Pyrinomonadaceae bacterium]